MLREFVVTLPRVVGRCFQGAALAWHALAIGLTILIVASGLDWTYFVANRTSILQRFALPAGILGFFVPVFLPLFAYALGAIRKSSYGKRAAFALAQAALVGWLISAAFKTFTGRIEPPFRMFGPLTDASHSFNFGFFRHGIFWGWPSSHATVAFAVSTALVFLFPKHRGLALVAILYAALIALGASVSFHWLSDVVAGMIMGTVAGATVARAYRGHPTP